ncbi:MAG: hypothetical protein KY438_04080 [Actinobacteria bacterium]|nr:hypothetical protein [Actinomycetota bacterium]
MRRRLLKGTLAFASVVALAITGCGDDPAEVAGGNAATEVAGDSTGGEAPGGNLERYCELQRALQSEGDAEKLDELAAVAPPEIAQEVGSVTEAYKVVLESGDEHAAEAVAEQEAAMHAFNEERCGIPNPLEEQ